MSDSQNSINQENGSLAASQDRWLTVPNGLCVVRLVGSCALIPIALQELPSLFLAAYLALMFTDWIDGRIARWYRQSSRIGPKLDTAADVAMYSALLFGTIWMFGSLLVDESLLISVAVVSYGFSCLASLLKFHRLPSYHTRGAKLSSGLMLAAVISLFLGWSLWPLRVAAFCVTLTNLEAILITLVLSESRDNVPTVFHALSRR